MKLITDLVEIEDVTLDQFREAIRPLETGESARAILAVEDEIYMQAGWVDNGFVIEKRAGGADRHYFARHDPPREKLPLSPEQSKQTFLTRLLLGPRSGEDDAFHFDEVVETLSAWLEGRDPPEYLTWKRGY